MIVAAGPGRGRRRAAGSARRSASLDRQPRTPPARARERREPGERRTFATLWCAPLVRRSGALGLVQFQRVSVLRTDDCPVLARFTSGEPALVDCASGEGHALVIASDLDNRGNDFPLHATFVPFLHESLRYLAGGEQRPRIFRGGRAGRGRRRCPASRPCLGRAGVQPGSCQYRSGGNRSGAADGEEFQRPPSPPSGGGAQAGARLQAQEQEERQHIWQYVLAMMLAMMVVESWVATRIA